MRRYYQIRAKNEQWSIQFERKTVYVFLILFFMNVLLFLSSLSIGSDWIHPIEVVKHLVGQGNPQYDFVINVWRLPRTLLAIFVGCALAVSGLILQGIIRNPLASPDIIGITSGGSVGAIVFIGYFMGAVSIQWLSLAAIIGAAIVATLIYLLSWSKGVTPIRLVLMGIGISAIMNALVTMLMVMSDTAITTKSYLWLTGSLYGASWSDIQLMFPWLLLCLLLTYILARTMAVKELGDDIATSLGVKVQIYRVIFLAISVVLAGIAVAFAGGIGFIGLMAPHIARTLIGRSFAGLIPVSALVGSFLVMAADLIGRSAFLPSDIPAGVFTASIGAPFFIYLLYRN
ncbi:FecCD family ABC transporter permease [Alkalihalobacillus pseudalcaliphilus]|uniref:FecCD family ABC transporter permease n=1 Tax=Alkalihalobacillus pseudalcaliphilus TaxID=79884 RepID=UPI00064DF901|nr:iron ABC transporter permease [Alkalihalobacillus pseudalcaliphilus]KMK75232.1 iron ABC transporter permease [Alkalihalobacillus pseudalcaliphilus]